MCGSRTTLSIVPAVRFYRWNAEWDVGTVGDTRVRKNIGWVQTDIGIDYRVGGR